MLIKKIVYLFVALILFQLPSNAIEISNVLNLKTGNSYIIPLDSRAMNIKNSNTKIVNVDAVSGIYEDESSLLITTMDEGISYVTFKLKDKEITMKLLIDNIADEDKTLLKLDEPQEYKKQ